LGDVPAAVDTKARRRAKNTKKLIHVAETKLTPAPFSTRRLGILISGRGSNLQAIIEAIGTGRLTASVGIVIANDPAAQGLQRARAAGIETAVLPHRDWPSRDAYDRALVAKLREYHVDLVCLAGFMRLLGPAFIDAFPNRVVNVHPSLLPSFPGVDAQSQALQHGVKVSGATVHFVTTELDAGPIIVQAAVPVLDGDTTDALADRILQQEHRLYSEAIQLVLDGGWSLVGRRFTPAVVSEKSRQA
jgi:phosphoribosylglycinamide formyltransferase 1